MVKKKTKGYGKKGMEIDVGELGIIKWSQRREKESEGNRDGEVVESRKNGERRDEGEKIPRVDHTSDFEIILTNRLEYW